VYRPKLVRRLRNLEKKLSIPGNERVLCTGSLQQAQESHITGVRVRTTIDATGKFTAVDTKPIKLGTSDSIESKAARTAKVQMAWTGKSVWVGNDSENVNVETLALQHYEKLGFKGQVRCSQSCGTSLMTDTGFTPKGES
jgi:fanconi-associated nuclease 1